LLFLKNTPPRGPMPFMDVPPPPPPAFTTLTFTDLCTVD
jgi:hypothetical protein